MPMFKSYAFGHFGNVVSKISWTEKSGKDTPSHTQDPATALLNVRSHAVEISKEIERCERSSHDLERGGCHIYCEKIIS